MTERMPLPRILIFLAFSALGLLGWFAFRSRPVKAAPWAQAGNSSQTTFSGQALGLRATVLGVTTTLADTEPLPSSGGSLEASLLSANVPGLASAEVLHATTIGQGDRTRSEASLANLNLTVGGNTVSADLLAARAMAVCGSGPSGSSQLANLVINGKPISVSGEPNQTLALPNGQVIINEQSTSSSSTSSSITVNALHVRVNGIADVVVSSAHADITCTGKPACTGSDFTTGGGWITGTPSGAKANFGVAGGIKNGAFWGHLEYIDHGPTGPKVHGTGVTNYEVISQNTREIDGTAEINGQGGFTYRVTVVDNGSPGTSDQFTIRLSNGYQAGGLLGGGNIQIHTPCH